MHPSHTLKTPWSGVGSLISCVTRMQPRSGSPLSARAGPRMASSVVANSRARSYRRIFGVRDSRRVACAIGLSLLTACACNLLSDVRFHANDDSVIQAILSGDYTGGTTDGHVLFVNYTLSWAVSRLFVLMPGHVWRTMALYASITVALFWCNYVLLGVVRPSGYSVGESWLPVAVCLVVDFGLFALPLASPTFTFSSCFLGGAAVFSRAVRFGRHSADRREALAETMLLLCSFCFRMNSGIVSIGIYALVLLADAWEQSNNLPAAERIRVAGGSLRALAPVMALCFFCWLLHRHAYSSPAWQACQSISKARAAYVDYRHSAYADNQELYRAVGWSSPLKQLVSNWFFTDPPCDTRSLCIHNRA